MIAIFPTNYASCAKPTGGNAEAVLGQFGLGALVAKQTLQWKWVIVEGFDLRRWRRTVDSNLYVRYAVEDRACAQEKEKWISKGTQSAALNWEVTRDKFKHAPKWWSASSVTFLTTAMRPGGDVYVFVDQTNCEFYVYANLLP